MRKVYVLLTKFDSATSHLLYYAAGQEYTHASIALDEAPEVYYSFSFHGFVVETPEKHRKHGLQKQLRYQLEVSEKAYKAIKKQIRYFEKNKLDFHYTRFGVLCCMLHLPFRRRNHYFCSQFVAELLKNSQAMSSKRKACLYMPNHLRRELGWMAHS